MLAEVTRKRDALRDKETQEVGETPNLDLIFGLVKFAGAKQIVVTSADGQPRTLTADHIVIATGARARLLNIPGLPAERLLTNELLFDITHLPRHLAIIGAGIIAVEMAFALRKLGTKITLIALDVRCPSTRRKSQKPSNPN